MRTAKEVLTSSDKFHIELGLERVKKLLDFIGNPQDDINFIHVAGTNGKGSVCAILDEILNTHFHGVALSENLVNIGLFTSPHLFKYNERIKINQKAIPDADLDECVNFINDSAQQINLDLTEFEILTCSAFYYFKKNAVKIAVLEVGLGGRLDATNVIKNSIAEIITTIDFDHTERLGNTIEKIATEKAGIIKENSKVIISDKNLGFDTVHKIAKTKHSKVFAPNFEIKNEFGEVFINGEKNSFSLLGAHQAENLALALECVRHLPFEVSKNVIATAVENVKWKFRLEYIKEKNLLIDSCHNPSGIRTLRSFLDEFCNDKKINFIFGCLKIKDYNSMLRILLKPANTLYFCEFDYPNALKYTDLPKNIEAKKIINREEILKLIENNSVKNNAENKNDNTGKNGELTVVCGSIYMLGKIFMPDETPVEPNPPSCLLVSDKS